MLEKEREIDFLNIKYAEIFDDENKIGNDTDNNNNNNNDNNNINNNDNNSINNNDNNDIINNNNSNNNNDILNNEYFCSYKNHRSNQPFKMEISKKIILKEILGEWKENVRVRNTHHV